MNLVRMTVAGAVVTAATFAAACSSSSREGGTSTDALVINPTGSEHESHLILQLPTDACQPGATCARVLGQTPSVFVDGSSVAIGANTRLKPGPHNVAVNNVGWQVTTVADQNLTVVLPIVARKCTKAALPNIPDTQFGGSVSVTNAACPTTVQGSATGVPSVGSKTEYYDASCSQVWETTVGSAPNCSNARNSPYSTATYAYRTGGGACVTTGIGYDGCVAAANSIITGGTPGLAVLTDAYQAYVPGTITATVNGTTQTLTLNAGDEADFNLNLPAIGNVPPTFSTTLTFLEQRVNPDATRATITSSCSGDRSYTVPSVTGQPAPITLNAFVNSGCTYTLNVAGRTVTLNQASANSIRLNRLDVNAVTITREDGSTYTTNGTYTLNYGGVQVAGPYPTGTGIDVLPGTYQFSVSYTTFDGPQTQTQTITF